MGRKIYITEAQLRNLMRESLIKETSEPLSDIDNALSILKGIASGNITDYEIERQNEINDNQVDYIIFYKDYSFGMTVNYDLNIKTSFDKGSYYVQASFDYDITPKNVIGVVDAVGTPNEEYYDNLDTFTELVNHKFGKYSLCEMCINNEISNGDFDEFVGNYHEEHHGPMMQSYDRE